jgi:hypothetical protein
MPNVLASSEKRNARKYLAWFEGINAASFVLISGQVMILYLLRLGADSFYIGLVSSFQYLSFIFMLIGRAVVGRMGLRRMMRSFWTLRYILVIPVLFSPLLVSLGYRGAGLIVVALALLGFNVARGVAIIGFNPILGMVTEKKSMGAYLSRLQIIYHGASLVCAVLVALSIGASAPLWRYIAFIALGIGLGLWGSSLIARFPDPVIGKSGEGSFLSGIKTAGRRPDFRRFIIHFFLLSVVTGMAVPFIIVYAKAVYLRSDRAVMALTVIGGLGAVSMGLFSRLLMDRIGPKPLYLLYTLLFTVSLIPLVVAPDIRGASVYVLLAFVFFLYHAGQMGGQVASRNYFYAITGREEHLNLGIVYQLMMGTGNALGALAGGAVLRGLVSSTAFSTSDGYRLYFGMLLLFCMVMMATTLFIKDAGRYSIGNALSIIFSPRDLRAVVLLDKLDRSSDMQQEMDVLSDLAGTGSPVAVEDVMVRLNSPRFYVRARALRALERAPVDARITGILLREVKKRTYTTAHIAARIIGRKGIKEGEGVLRQALKSPDYLLKANALIALARIGGDDKHLLIEESLSRSHNPMVLMHGAVALQLLGNPASLSVLAGLLKRKDPPPFLRDEIILSMAALLSMERWFYPLYSLFQAGRKDGIEELLDRFDSSLSREQRENFADLREACTLVLRNIERFRDTITPVFSRIPLPGGLDYSVLEGMAADRELMRFERLRFFIAAMPLRMIIGNRERRKRVRRNDKKSFRRHDDPIDI